MKSGPLSTSQKLPSLQLRYFSDLPFTALWGAKYLPISRHISEFYEDAAAGTLPQVSFVEPRFFGESLGISNDDHPFADIRNGQAFLNQVYEAVTSSPNWANTVMVINYDERTELSLGSPMRIYPD